MSYGIVSASFIHLRTDITACPATHLSARVEEPADVHGRRQRGADALQDVAARLRVKPHARVIVLLQIAQHRLYTCNSGQLAT